MLSVRMMLPLSLAGLGVATGVAAAQTAAPFSTPPTPKSYAITATSIGGVSLGTGYAQAIKTFGPGSTCDQTDAIYAQDHPGQTRDPSTIDDTCSWLGGSTSGGVALYFKAGKVTAVNVHAALGSSGQPSNKGVPGKFVLKKGSAKITVGIANTKIPKLYPKAIVEPQDTRVVSGKRELYFGVANSRIASITLQAKGASSS